MGLFFKEMKLLSRFIVLFCLVSIGAESIASDSTNTSSISKIKRDAWKMQLELKGVVLMTENNFGGRIHSNGFSLFYENLKFITVNKKRLWQADFYYHIDYKEKTITTTPFNLSADLTPSFQFGRQNELFGFRLNYGFKKELSDKMEKNGVKVAMVYSAGITLGFLKPYNLLISRGTVTIDTSKNLAFYDENSITEESYNKENAAIFTSKGLVQVSNNQYAFIRGSSNFLKGFGELQFVPGINAKFGFNFDWGPTGEIVKEMEVGVMLDIYNKPMPLYINNPNSPFFMTFYLAVGIGKRK